MIMNNSQEAQLEFSEWCYLHEFTKWLYESNKYTISVGLSIMHAIF